MATAKKTTDTVITIKPLDMREVVVTLEGDTSLIMHKWSEKAKKQMLDNQTGEGKGKQKPKKSPARDFVDCIYFLSGAPDIPDSATEDEVIALFEEAVQNGATFGFPATAFIQAAQSASYRLGWTKSKMELRGMFFIEDGHGELLEIKSDPPIMREDMVKIGMGTADIRYRPEFKNWHTTFKLRYNANGPYSLENIINMLNAGGTVCGAGEWRPERDGQFGMYHIATEPIAE